MIEIKIRIAVPLWLVGDCKSDSESISKWLSRKAFLDDCLEGVRGSQNPNLPSIM